MPGISAPSSPDAMPPMPIHAMGPSDDTFGSPHRSSQPSSMPRWLACVCAMSYARRRTSTSFVRSRTMYDISTAC